MTINDTSAHNIQSTTVQPTNEKSGPGCLTFTLFLIAMIAVVGIAIYLMTLFTPAPTAG